ncbi:flagellar export chaperone FliS [Pseudodesulfovibrio tunisiensis]|uniref:flagellar export chaperone FliS n=1 Tax=Pseudodesulfovibrio tunisiensis TaxID=463192 RepID=UPI001FB293F9|nr:flagellar export chaperone FliS [Pseudodesulfovibrio tunisiensis]
MANPAKAYLATQVETTTQGELLIMLYDAAIKFLKRAKMEMENRDFAKKGIYISKAMAIIHELAECLNREKGGEITPKLSQLYFFCTTHLTKANIRMDTKMIDDVIKIMQGLRSAYAQIVPQHEGTAPAAKPQARSIPQIPRPQAVPGASVPTPPTGMARPKMPTPPRPAQSTVRPPAEQQTANPAPEAAAAAPESAPAPKPTPQPVQPPKRPLMNATRLRARNAYGSNR